MVIIESAHVRYHVVISPMFVGRGQFGERNIADQAEEFLHCARGHQHNFRVPQIIFIFTNGVTTPLKMALTQMGLDVQGTEVDVDEDTRQKLQQLEDSVISSSDECENSAEEDEGTEGEEDAGCDTDNAKDESPQENTVPNRVSGLQGHPPAAMPAQQLPSISNPHNKLCDTSSQNTVPEEGPHRAVSPYNAEEHRLLSAPPKNQPSILDGVQHLVTLQPEVCKVNLDITTLISLASNLCHGRCGLIFQEEVLCLQARQEREVRLLPTLESFMKGRLPHTYTL